MNIKDLMPCLLEADISPDELGKALEIENLNSNEEIFCEWLKTGSTIDMLSPTIDMLYRRLVSIGKEKLGRELRKVVTTKKGEILRRKMKIGKEIMDAITRGNVMQFPLTLLPCFWLQKKEDIPFVISCNNPSHCIRMIIVVGRSQRVGSKP